MGYSTGALPVGLELLMVCSLLAWLLGFVAVDRTSWRQEKVLGSWRRCRSPHSINQNSPVCCGALVYEPSATLPHSKQLMCWGGLPVRDCQHIVELRAPMIGPPMSPTLLKT